mmetsp:Transcript_77901/g.215307  ORF Transcript_77901/g.215307 Transcript_77901/m.215307 type:complete len:291 (-) Transcript_77901:294-1166(-)
MEQELHRAHLGDQICALWLLDLHRAEHSGNSNGGRALDIIVVAKELVAILSKQRKRIVRVKVLELKQASLSKQLGGCSHELIDEAVLTVVGAVDICACRRLVLHAVSLQARVHVVVADHEATRVALGARAARINDNRDRPGGIKATADSVQVQLPERDTHAPSAQVTQSEDSIAVGEDHALALIFARFILWEHLFGIQLQHLLDIALVRDAHITTTLVEWQQPEFLASLTDSGRVGHGEQQTRVCQEHAVVQVHVLARQSAKICVSPKVVPEAHDAANFRKRLLHRGCLT